MQMDDENVLINYIAKIWIEDLTLGTRRSVEEQYLIRS
jgi:hypothetical protein